MLGIGIAARITRRPRTALTRQMEDSAANINPVALTFLAIMSLVILNAKRPHAVGAVLVTAAFVPLGQNLVIFGYHFYFMRLLVLVGFARVIMRREYARFQWVKADKLFLWWVVIGFLCGLLRGPTAETFGFVYDSCGIYFMLRILTPDAEDLLTHLKVLAGAAIVMACCMSWEAINHRNLFSVLGGVPESPLVRDGRVRAQGPFRHSILAGTFGATLFPLMAGLWFQLRRRRWIASVAGIACIVATAASGSSGPMLCLIVSVGGLGLWRVRHRLSLIRKSIVFGIVALALIMNAPVWYLISRVSELAGGTGWYRSYLIDQAIKHIGEWWLIGSSHTAHWASVENVLISNPNSMDITNHYLVQGLDGGLLMVTLFLALIWRNFKTIGLAGKEGNLPLDKMLIWAFGVALLSHCAAFISVSYFDQIKVFWFWLLAAIAALAPSSHGSETVKASVESEGVAAAVSG